MEGLLDLFECVIESPRHGEYLQEFMTSCTEHQAFYNKKSNVLQPFVSFTNSKLNTPSERLEGLLLLKTFLPQCSDEQFLDNAISWMHQCVKGIESSKSLETNNAAFSVLKTLLEMASSFQELTKGIANSVNAKFAEQLKLKQEKPQVRLSALQCIQTMIRNYGAPCTPHKAVIESFVLQEVDSKDAGRVSAASRCFAVLPLVGGAGPHGANHKARWLEQQRRTCGTLRLLLDQLLDGVDEVETFGAGEGGGEILPLEGVEDANTVVRTHEVANRFVNVAKFLEAMLLNEFPVSKSVLPDTIINLVCRGLSVNCVTLGNKGSSDVLAVGSVLPRIHVALLRVLNALVVCLGKNLYPQARLVCRLVLQTLEWTGRSVPDRSFGRPYPALRVEACRALVAWLRVAKAGSCVEAIADELVRALLTDVSTEKTAVKLSIQGGKRNKKRKHNASGDETALTSTPVVVPATRVKLGNVTANGETCRAALDALYWLVHSAGALVKPTVHKLLQETVLLVLFDIQRSGRNDVPVPYSKVECRMSLYKLLQALTLDPHPMWPPPTQFAVHVLARGQADPSSQVSGLCTVALCSVEKLIHSSSQALQFPVSLEEVLRGVSMDPVVPRPAEEPGDGEDVASNTSRCTSSLHSTGPSCPSPDLACPPPPLPPSREEELSDVSTVVFPESRRSARDVTAPPAPARPPPADLGDVEDEAECTRTEVDGGPSEESSQSAVTVVTTTEVKTETRLFRPKLLGGGEVVKVTRFEPRPRLVNLDDEGDEGSVVDLSSDEELHESNMSVVSSNSNYQESLLNKSAAALEELVGEDDVVVTTDTVQEEEEEGVLVIDFGQTPTANGEEDNDCVVDWEEPASKRTKRDSCEVVGEVEVSRTMEVRRTTVEVNGTVEVSRTEEVSRTVEVDNGIQEVDNGVQEVDNEVQQVPNGTGADNFEGMSDAEVVKALLDDFKKKLDE